MTIEQAIERVRDYIRKEVAVAAYHDGPLTPLTDDPEAVRIILSELERLRKPVDLSLPSALMSWLRAPLFEGEDAPPEHMEAFDLITRLARERNELRQESLAPALEAMTAHREELLAWVQQVYFTICGAQTPDAMTPDVTRVKEKWGFVGAALSAAESRVQQLETALRAIPEMVEDSADHDILAVVRTALEAKP